MGRRPRAGGGVLHIRVQSLEFDLILNAGFFEQFSYEFLYVYGVCKLDYGLRKDGVFLEWLCVPCLNSISSLA